MSLPRLDPDGLDGVAWWAARSRSDEPTLLAPAAPEPAPTVILAPAFPPPPRTRSLAPVLVLGALAATAAVVVVGVAVVAMVGRRGTPAPAPRLDPVAVLAAEAPADPTPPAPEEPPAPEPAPPTVDVPGEPVVFPGEFAWDGVEPSAVSEEELGALLARLRACPGKVVVTGHACKGGDPAYNDWLREQRAQAVVALLAARGLGDGRLVATSRGSAEPRATNQTAAGRNANRRVTVACHP